MKFDMRDVPQEDSDAAWLLVSVLWKLKVVYYGFSRNLGDNKKMDIYIWGINEKTPKDLEWLDV